VFRVQADGFDHEVEFVGAIDLARYAVGHVGPDELGFREVVESINSPCIAVLHEEHGIRRIIRPRDQNEVIGAEVEHGERRAGAINPRPPQQRRCGVSRRTPPAGLSSQRGASSVPALGFLSRRIGIFGFAQTFATQQEDLGVFHQTVSDRGGDRGVEEDVPPVGERCVGCNNRRAFLAVACRDDLIEEIGGLLIEGKIS
jgi:hypothetical protein